MAKHPVSPKGPASPDTLNRQKTPPTASGAVLQQTSGIPGLDEALNGGIPTYSLNLLAGTSGTGKTILSFQWLFDGATKGENGLYISITEPLFMALRNIESMGFYDRKLIEQQTLRLFDLKEEIDYTNIEPQSLLRCIEKQVKQANAKRVVIDSITGILFALNHQAKTAHFLFELKKLLASLGCTSILISKVTEQDRYSVLAVEELVPDGVISLSTHIGENKIIRRLRVVKMRGISYRSGALVFDITQQGVLVYPKIPISDTVSSTEFKTRLSSGIKELDTLCGGAQGGFPEGHVIMYAGNTGSGKTTFGLQFLIDGLEKGEGAVFVALEEPVSQVRKTAHAHSWDLDCHLKSGRLVILNPGLIDLNTDQLLYQIVNAVRQTDAKRVVFDSVSSLESGAMSKNKVRDFLIQLSLFMKSTGATSVITYLSDVAFGAELGQLLGRGNSNELRLSSITDGIILLRYVERGQSVAKLMNILKMRGSPHDKKIWAFEVAQEGVKILNVFQKYTRD